MIEAKGRNGYFHMGSVEVWRTGTGSEQEIQIDFLSTKPGKNPPVRIQGKIEEIISLMSKIYIETVSLRMGGPNVQRIEIKRDEPPKETQKSEEPANL
jgi:hypothetical protein